MWMWTRKAVVLVDEVEPRTRYRKWSRVRVYAKGVSEACGGPGSTRENRIDRVEPEEKRIAAAGKHRVCSLHPVWE